MKIDFRKDKIPFTQVANDVLNDSKLSAKAKGIYAYLYSKPEGWNFAIDRIKDDFSDGRLAINTGLRELEKEGYLLRQKEKTGRVVYLLKSQMTKIDIRGIKPDDENRNLRKPQSAEIDTISNKDTKVIKNINNKNISFDQFWTEYPRKTAKAVAQRAWLKIKPNEKLLNEILEGLRKYKNTDQWKDPRYIPHPATFLNQRRWEDEITEEKETKILDLTQI